MFSKGRKLVNLVKQNDQRREISTIRSTPCNPSQMPAKKAESEKPSNVSDNGISRILEMHKLSAIQISEFSEINEGTVLADESLNSTTSEQNKISKQVLIPESPEIDMMNHEVTTDFDTKTATPVHHSSKYFTDLDSGSIIEDSSNNLSNAINTENATLHSDVSNAATDLQTEIIAPEYCTHSLDNSCSDLLELDLFRESPIPPSSHSTNQFISLPSTSRQDAAEILSDNSDVVSPYVDSESSFCPTPSSLPLPSSSEDSESEKENEDCNVPKRRRNKGQPEKWHRNIVKKLRQTGQSYINRKGKIVEPRICVATDCSKCRYKCNEKFPENMRRDIFDEYWKLGDDRRQKMFLTSLIKHSNVLRRATQAKKNRSMSRSYFLAHRTAGEHRVCQKIFCNTFNVSTTVINSCSKKVGYCDFYVGQDSRVGKIPCNKTPIHKENLVKGHIDMYPRMESHYCRKHSKKQYLESDLNLSQLYKMYKEDYCVQKDIRPVSKFVYDRIFHSYEPPLAFYKPKKDQCTKCNVYNRAEDKSPLQVEHEAHKKRELDSLNMKAEDKQKCFNSDGTFRAITFDLQAILSVPFTGDSKIFYLRKLSLYNFTILDCFQNTGHCYMWDECNGKKGSIEIGTMLLNYFRSLPENVNHVASFSDTCGGQNRNKFATLAALYAVNNIPHLETVDLKFMESGHSYLEADSMHACIERARKHKSIFTLREYALIIQSARSKPKPYDVFISKYDEFLDLKTLEKELKCNMTQNTEKEIVQWLKIKWLRLCKDHPTSVFYKYDLQDPSFLEISLNKTRSAKKQQECIKKLRTPMKKAYESQILVSQSKKKDLMTLLKDGVIPSEYANYYNSIPCASEISHTFTDSEESDDE